MQPSGDHTDDEDSGTSDDDETSVASADAEEQAYLLEIQQQDKSGRRTATPSRSSSTSMYRSPVSPTLSRASAHSAAAARYYNSNNNNSSRVMRGTNNSRAQMRAPSAASSVTGGAGRRISQASPSITPNTNINNKKRTTTTSINNNNNNNNRLGGGMFVEQVTEPFDPHVNPWAQQPSTVRQYKVDDGHSETSSMNNDPAHHHHQQQQHPHHHHQQQRPSIIQLPSPVISATSANATLLSSPAQPPQRHLQSPSSAASSMTATGPAPVARVEGGLASSSSVVSQSTNNNNNNNNNSLLTDQQYTSVVALGPATKRALDTLQAEIIALNDRIDGLRQELVERDRHKVSSAQDGDDDDSSRSNNSNKESWDGWRWVVKAAVKHAAMNLLMASLLFLALYRQKSPVAYVILGQIAKHWRRTKLRLTISKILV
ncbi:hypothetical protein BDB00DRAFT_137282 [Zychaea mexicana]|uniref:uncharacterized protein n=1 Tax=Zychaea mexicana TaxID=64656 RepID=UPI0022FF0511|nr:uncharacterized protein BDB00DRAFT_137282 [Zychaea mexicana]KAI9496226.1 hypothetical protein BDB00DRAFT_137282 [Zychaea mexicana]